jgi:hypothetical protein
MWIHISIYEWLSVFNELPLKIGLKSTSIGLRKGNFKNINMYLYTYIL